MKMKLNILLASTLSLLALVTGCETGGILTSRPVVETVTVPVPGEPGQTHVVTITNTVWGVDTNWLHGINAARQINNAANPTPSAPLVELGLAGLLAGLGWYARIKTKKAQGAQELVDTLIAGVEKAGNPEVKSVIKEVASNRGTQPALDAAVNGR